MGTGSNAGRTARVRELLAGNRVVAGGGRWRYTRPAEGTYPHQWLWDSCFHALLHHRLGDPGAAADELRALFRAQVTDGPDRGRLPHMTLLGGEVGEDRADPAAADQYRRDLALWGDPRASSITQPPIVAEVALEIGDPALWRELWPGLRAHLDWWLRRRDPRGERLLVCHHVWETGADATPRADAAAARLLATGRTPRALAHGTVNPTARKRGDLLAARFLMLEDLQAIDAAELSGALDAAEADRRRLALYGHVAVEVQAFLVHNLRALARIGDALGESAAAAADRAAADSIAAAFNERLWDEARGWYLDRWGEPALTIETMSYAPLVALYAEGLVPPERAARLLDHLTAPDRFWTRWPVPTVARGDPSFDPDQYWRGSTWINVNWFIVRGLIRAGGETGEPRFRDAARHIARASLELTDRLGYREYYRSDGAEPAAFGPERFSWSGLALDLERLLAEELG